MSKFIVLILLNFILLNLTACIYGDNCELKETCSACIRSQGCAWCTSLPDSDILSNATFIQCKDMTVNSNTSTWCPEESIYYPRNYYKILRNEGVRAGADPIQIQPQRIKLTLRQGEETNIDFVYKQALDYPIDLYFLMDLSASMEIHKNKLSKLGIQLAKVMRNASNNLQLGFGSFVDKPEMPYVNTVPEKLKTPCFRLDKITPCVSPYSYKNHMSLTDDTDSFTKNVENAQISGNMDYPEGGFDALMQVLVCKEKIGWRNKSRKLVIFSTDASFHLAGDGKLAGIVEPNDEQCHLENGSYTHALLQDYPSISQIDKQARENNINIIFAVTEKQIIYKTLKENIYGASSGTLTKDSSNVIDIVKIEYEKLVKSISISDNSDGSVEILYYSNCTSNITQQTNKCSDWKERPEIHFRAVIKALDCPTNKNKWSQTIEIKPGSLDESLIIDLDIICQCPCENPDDKNYEEKSVKCNSNGNFQCGICSCDSGRYGRFCECDGNQAGVSPSESNTTNCRADTTDEVCSGLGFCKCGKCDCNQRTNPDEHVYGTFCECNNYNCKRNAGLLCSGLDNGRCECGKCICQSGWSGPACECKENNATCIEPGSTNICSDHGKCECGVCQCKLDDNFRYSGKYCQECPHCTGHRCDELAPCVECQIHKTGTYNETQCIEKCNAFTTVSVDRINKTIFEGDETHTERICRVPDSTGCSILFKYMYGDDLKLSIEGQKNKECPKEIDFMAVIFGVVGATVFLGLLLIVIWKIMTTIHDKREYAKFENEKSKAKFDRGDNPLYKPSVTQFNNPTFGSVKRK